jgi:hypothetical protein
MPQPPEYGIIYNWDGAPHGYSKHPQSMEAFLEKMYAPMEDTQVGAHFWCCGGDAVTWKSDDLETVGDLYDRKYENALVHVNTENIRAMLERGEDPLEAAIRRGRELGLHVYASVRMNDNHFRGAQIGDLPRIHDSALTRMRIDHPEWLLGEQTSDWFALSWNIAVPEVREHRFAHIQELCSRYDWDGVELDWQRHAFHLPDDFGYRLRYVITDLQRAVKRMADELGEQRGRPFYVASRVSGSLEGCRHIGYDIPAWTDEGLMDLLIPSGGSGTDPDVDVESFVQLCEPGGIAVYPALYGSLPDPHIGPEDSGSRHLMRSRAIAARYFGHGASGIYVFNYHANRESRREHLTQLGSPESLRGKDKIYSATYRNLRRTGSWRNAEKHDRLRGSTPTPLKRTLTGDGPTIMLDLADDLSTDSPREIELRLRIDEWVNGDVIQTTWDGEIVEKPKLRYDHDSISDVSSAASLCFPLSEQQARLGRHEVKVALMHRNAHVLSDPVLTHVDVAIQY